MTGRGATFCCPWFPRVSRLPPACPGHGSWGVPVGCADRDKGATAANLGTM